MSRNIVDFSSKRGAILLWLHIGILWAFPAFAIEKSQSIASIDDATEQELMPQALAQASSVSDLTDIQPGHWAYQAVQSLIEDYSCLSGYPDNTFRGERFMTRYEFAASLYACLEQLRALGIESAVPPDELETIQRLQEEFASELALLRNRVDTLETEVAELEVQQFSTTTKLQGEVIFTLSGATGGSDGQDAELAFNNRLRLNLNTSFTGSDLLITGLQSFDYGGGVGISPSSLPGALGLGDPVFGTASNVTLGTAPQFGRTSPDTLENQGENSVGLYKLLYVFPVADRLTMFVGSNVEATDALGSIASFADESQGAISRFATTDNAVMRVSGGTSGIGLASAGGAIWNISDSVDLTAFYGSVNAQVAENNGLTGTPPTPLGAGLFGGSYVISSQLTADLTESLTFRFNYANSYHQLNILGTGLTASDIGSVAFTPSAQQIADAGGSAAIAVLDEGIRLNSFGSTLNWKIAPKFDLTLSGSYIMSDLVGVDASTDYFSWLVGAHFQDVFSEGNTAALIFGQPLNRIATGGRAFDPENADPFHLEGYFNWRVTDRISVTPGVYAVFNPEGNSNNDTTVVGVLRTTFTF